jgi:hypothetical protein
LECCWILKKSIDYAYFSFVLISFFTFQTHSFARSSFLKPSSWKEKMYSTYGRLTDDDDDSLKIRLSFTAHINIYKIQRVLLPPNELHK